MTSFEKYIYEHLHLLRRTIQILTVVFIFFVPFLNKSGFKEIIGTFYSISFGNLDIVDPALMLQNLLLTKEIYFPLLLAGVIPLILALFFGKVFCGWVCPYNFLAEFAVKLGKKFKSKKKNGYNRNPKPQLYWFIFGTVLTVIALSGLPLITFISMPGLISAQAADFIFFGTIGLEMIFVILILFIEMFTHDRFWCKYMCPVGATLGILRFKHSLAVHYDAQVCRDKCPTDKMKLALCNSVCPINLNPRQKNIYPYCINCGECVNACQNKGEKAVSFTFHPQEKNESIIKKMKIADTQHKRKASYGN